MFVGVVWCPLNDPLITRCGHSLTNTLQCLSSSLQLWVVRVDGEEQSLFCLNIFSDLHKRGIKIEREVGEEEEAKNADSPTRNSASSRQNHASVQNSTSYLQTDGREQS